LHSASDDGIVVVMGVVYETRKRKKRKGVEMTTAEYLATPETMLPAELAFGVMRVADAPAVRHQRMVGELYKVLDAHVTAHALGEVLLAPTDVILDYDRALVVQPDLVFVSSGRAGIVSDRVEGAPDLVVEVLSPHPRIGALAERMGWFASYGVRECWLANLRERQYAILSLDQSGVVGRQLCEPGDVAPSSVVPGVKLPAFPGW
jgi:Uma2 family endonuclease